MKNTTLILLAAAALGSIGVTQAQSAPEPVATRSETYVDKRINIRYYSSGKLTPATVARLKAARADLRKSDRVSTNPRTFNLFLTIYYTGSKKTARKVGSNVATVLGVDLPGTFVKSSTKTSKLTYVLKK
jgi:uncharacterized protein YcbK (DUF882 family)